MIIEGESYIGNVPTVAQAVGVLGDRWQAGLDEADMERFYRDISYTVLHKMYFEQKDEIANLRGRLHVSENRIIDLQRLIAEREIAAAGVEARGTAV